MRVFFGATLFSIGLIAILFFGLFNLFAYDAQLGQPAGEAWIALLLIMGGEITATGGASLTKDKHSARDLKIAKWFFTILFSVSCLLLLIGLFNVFAPERTFLSIVLLGIGIVGALSSASNALTNGV